MSAKYEDYREANDRISVIASYLSAELDLGSSTHFSAQAVYDAITGMTPTGQRPAAGSTEVPLATLVEDRRGVVVSATQALKDSRVRAEYAHSYETDYKSNGYAVSYVREFNQKNTEVQVGFSFTDDNIVEPFFEGSLLGNPRGKLSRDFLIGVTQLLDANTTLTVNFSHGLTTGFMSDPYKLVQKAVEIAPGFPLDLTFQENRPRRRTKDILFVQSAHFFENLKGSLDSSVRYYTDGFGINSTTLEAAWYQRVGGNWIIRPLVRYYRQSKADFYYPNLDLTNIVPVNDPVGTSPFYSSDYRLSAFAATTVGLQVIFNFKERYSIDAMFERYAMKGRDGGATPDSAFVTANTTTVGLKISF